MNTIDLKKIGFDDTFKIAADQYNGLYAGRVISQFRDQYKVLCEGGEVMAKVSGKFRYMAKAVSSFPAVGDFVMLDRIDDSNGNAMIHHILSRKSVFIRKAAGNTGDDQVVASNIDTIFLCMALNNDFNLRRLERYLSIGWDSGAVPVIVLTKSDLCEDLEHKLYEVTEVAAGVDILVTSAVEDSDYTEVKKYVKEGQTVALIGSSGVGKSTLINCLIGEKKLETNGLRNDDKGRHTTTKRELILLENAGMVIDTPGMRELGLESVNLSRAFSDIDELASMCKFRNCTHKNEPGCAVQAAICNGSLSEERFLSYQKLKKEAKYENLNSRQIETAKLDEMFGGIGGMKKFKKFVKEKNKRR